MMNAKMLGGALVGAMMVGCAGNATGADPAQLDVSPVSAAIDGRTDLFVDPVLSRHLLTADEVNGSPTAVAVEIELTESELIAWRAQPTVAAADRSRTDADIVARFDIVEGTPDLSTAVVIGDTTHPTQPGSTVNIPGGVGGHLGSHTGTGISHNTPFPVNFPEVTIPQLNINWSSHGGIPGSLDVNTYHNIATAHPGCA